MTRSGRRVANRALWSPFLNIPCPTLIYRAENELEEAASVIAYGYLRLDP